MCVRKEGLRGGHVSDQLAGKKGVREGFMKEVWIKSFLRNLKILIEEQIQGNSQRENCSGQGSLAIHIIILEMFFDPIILVVGILIYECKSFGKI